MLPTAASLEKATDEYTECNSGSSNFLRLPALGDSELFITLHQNNPILK